MIFGNLKPDLGRCSAIATNFAALVNEILAHPVRLATSKAEYFSLTKEERNRRKRVGYFIPAFMKGEDRRTENATAVSLVALDVDNPEEAKRMLTIGWSPLKGFACAVYHTASSTVEHPKLRVVLPASQLPVGDYPRVVAWLGGLLNIKPNKESLVAVQPMFFPIMFSDSSESPLIFQALGDAVKRQDYAATEISPTGEIIRADDDAGLEFLRAPLLGVDPDQVREMLEFISPDCSRAEWIEVGSALKHQFGDEGITLWGEWSQKSSSKYPGAEVIDEQWRSLRPHASGARKSVTMRTLVFRARHAGWQQASASALIMKSFREEMSRIEKPDTLLHCAVARLASDSASLLSSELATLASEVSRGLMKLPGGCAIKPTAILADVKQAARRLKQADLLEGKRALTPAGGEEVPVWARGLVFISSSGDFFKRETGEKTQTKNFDYTYGNHFVPAGSEDFRPSISPTLFVLNKVQCPRVIGTVYDPRTDSVITEYRGQKRVNLYSGGYPIAETDPDKIREAGRVIEDHVETLIIEPLYRELLLSWLAHSIQNPGGKIRWAPLIQGVPGCGKTALGALYAKAVGPQNVLFADADAVKRQWTEWAAGYQLVIIEEVRFVGESRHEIMNRLKPLITNDDVMIQQRHKDAYSVPNVTNYMLLTNHRDALILDEDDRRYFVLESRIQRKEQLAQLPDGYFQRLFSLDSGAVRAWFLQYEISPRFSVDGPAPGTCYRNALASRSDSPEVAEIRHLISAGEHMLVNSGFISLETARAGLLALGMRVDRVRLVRALSQMGYDRHVPVTLRDKHLDIYVHEKAPMTTEEDVLATINDLETL
jgi:hypothetical protein